AASSAPAAPCEVGAAPAAPSAQAAPAAPRAAGTPAPAAVRRRVPDTLMQTVTGAIIHEDERLLVIDKPAGIAVHGGSGVSFGIIEALRAARPQESDSLELVHRLDRDTSGVLLVARKPAVLRMLHASLREGEGFEKRYLALLKGSWQLGKKRIDAPLRTDLRVGGERTVKVAPMGKSAASDFRVVQSFGKVATLMEVSILTGRTHQIRVHAAYAGHPVAGDPKYGDAEFNEQMRDMELERMFLHASSLSFVWPDRGTEFSVNAPLPPELARVIDALSRPRPKRSRYRYKR
ncbi:MAG: RluA family pseudouridine synthase, partial [Xanthomonadales bacterium]|nr:RluA family pseudouridine synthase [Xanthomonadales bacterium]